MTFKGEVDLAGEAVGNWRRKTRRSVYDNPWITVYHDEVIHPGGGDGIYGTVHFKNLALGIIPLDDEDHTWLVGQHRYPQDRYSWEIPEGGGALDVDPLTSARRELREEVGLGAHHWESILQLDLSNSVSDEVALIYLATGLYPLAAAPDETEDLKLWRLPFDEAVRMALAGEITDAMSVAGLMKARLLRCR